MNHPAKSVSPIVAPEKLIEQNDRCGSLRAPSRSMANGGKSVYLNPRSSVLPDFIKTMDRRVSFYVELRCVAGTDG